MKHDVLITDVDNTIFDFVDFFGPALRSMVYVLADKCNTSEIRIYEELKDVFSNTGSIEHQTVIKSLPVVRNLNADRQNEVLIAGRRAFDKTRRARVVPYSGIVEVLAELKRRGVLVVALTNAPLYQAIRRLRIELGLSKYLFGIAGFVGSERDHSEEADSIKEKHAREYDRGRQKHGLLLTLEHYELKPSGAGFQRILDNINVDIRNVYALGDSVAKDLAPAAPLGCQTIWAKYGTRFEKRNFDTLVKVTPWSADQIRKYSSSDDFSPDHIVEHPLEILNLIDGTMPSLFDRL